MNIRQMEYFLAVAEAGNISAAAQRLEMTQPSLSTQLRLLEEELGVRLMERGGRRVHLTDAGQILYRRANAIVDLTETTVQEIRAMAGGTHAVLSLGTISSCGAILLGERLAQFHERYPHVLFELSEGNTFELLDKLYRGKIELAVVRTPFQEDGLTRLTLEREPLVLAAQASFFEGLPEGAVSLDALAVLPLIYYRRYEHLLKALLEKQSLAPTTVCKNDDARTCLLWARTGYGVALVPRSMVALLDNGRLHTRRVDTNELFTEVALVRRKDTDLSSAAAKFWDCFANAPFWDSDGAR